MVGEYEKLVKEQQIAHKAIACFYSRLETLIDRLAEENGFIFYDDDYSEYDDIPLIFYTYSYTHFQGDYITRGDSSIDVTICFDSNLEDEDYDLYDVNSNYGEAYINIEMYKTHKAPRLKSIKKWYNYDEEDGDDNILEQCEQGSWQDYGSKYFKYWHQQYSMSDFLADFENIANTIKTALNSPLEA